MIYTSSPGRQAHPYTHVHMHHMIFNTGGGGREKEREMGGREGEGPY